jgi:hypothetical protein
VQSLEVALQHLIHLLTVGLQEELGQQDLEFLREEVLLLVSEKSANIFTDLFEAQGIALK